MTQYYAEVVIEKYIPRLPIYEWTVRWWSEDAHQAKYEGVWHFAFTRWGAQRAANKELDKVLARLGRSLDIKRVDD